MAKTTVVIEGQILEVEQFTISAVKPILDTEKGPLICFLYGTKENGITHAAFFDKKKAGTVLGELNIALQNLP